MADETLDSSDGRYSKFTISIVKKYRDSTILASRKFNLFWLIVRQINSSISNILIP